MNVILVVDHDKAARDHISEYFTRKGYSIKVFEAGDDAVEEFRKGGCDVVILDADIDDSCGLATIARLKKINPHVPLIVVTSDGSLELEREIRSRGVFYYLVKPFEIDEMREAVESAIRKGNT